MHLFDVDMPGKITFRESETLTAGSEFGCFSTPWGHIGLGICYDLRFPELASVLRHERKCEILVYPGAFNTTTGPIHWELLLRARAVDQQCFVIGAAPAAGPNGKSDYPVYGHSRILNPMGEVVAQAGSSDESILYYNLDIKEIKETRRAIPTSDQKRTDLYSLPVSKLS